LRIVAFITFRNEELYLERCIQHLLAQGLEICLTDNGSTDRSLAIARSFLGRGVVHVGELSYRGCFELSRVLRNEERLMRELGPDWILHYDADEIREAPLHYQTLREGIEVADKEGFNAINFREFVFVPTSEDENFIGRDYVKEMTYYYYFSPRENHRLNAWKRQDAFDLVRSGGHRVQFDGVRVFPESFILRHYIALSREHAVRKYCQRRFSVNELQNGFHRKRAFLQESEIVLPRKSELHCYQHNGTWNINDPKKEHLLFVPKKTAHVPFALTDRPPMPFVVGVGRSGTTLLRLMLDAHSLMAIPTETHFPFHRIAQLTDDDEGREALCSVLTGHFVWHEFGISADLYRDALRELEPFSIGMGVRLFYAMYANRFRKPRFGDKTPPYNLAMDAVERVLPEARFIHVVRDGRDVSVSYRGLWFGPGDDVARQAAFWKERICKARELAQRVAYYMEVRYEDLVREPEGTLRKVCEFIELSFEKSMLTYHEGAKERLDEFATRIEPVGPDGRRVTKEQLLSIHARVLTPPDSRTIGRWRDRFSSDEVSVFRSIAGDLLRELGYPES